MEKTFKYMIQKILSSKILPYILLTLACVYIFMQRSCDGKIVPKGKETIVYDTIYNPVQLSPKEIIKYITKEGKEILVQGRIDTIKIKEFEKAPDSTKTDMFVDCKTIRQYNQTFKDSLADVDVFAETEGKLLKITPKVTIKARLPEKKTVFAVYGGGEIYVPFTLDKLGYKVNLRFQNKKGDLFSTGYDPINQVGFIGYDLRILNIKK